MWAFPTCLVQHVMVLCGEEVSMCEYLPHINSSFVDLHTEHVVSRYTALDTMESALHAV
jgi:hypothetical protein